MGAVVLLAAGHDLRKERRVVMSVGPKAHHSSFDDDQLMKL